MSDAESFVPTPSAARLEPDCLFCRISRGEIPAAIVYSDETVIAFDDISPQAPVHTLVIPREHFEHLGDDVPAAVASALLSAAARIARIKGIDGSGYRVIVNNGPDARQSVPHLHVHVVGGAPMSHGMVELD